MLQFNLDECSVSLSDCSVLSSTGMVIAPAVLSGERGAISPHRGRERGVLGSRGAVQSAAVRTAGSRVGHTPEQPHPRCGRQQASSSPVI